MSKSNSCTKRLMQELNELINDPSPEFTASPLESDILEFHFTIRGAANSPFEGGRYHGRLLFPKDYPFKPPNIIFLTPNGRFAVGKKICLSITGYHPESWRPAWGIRTALTAIISFMMTPGEGSVGAVDWSEEARRLCAKDSMCWKCSICGSDNRTALPLETQVPSTVLKAEGELMLSAPTPDKSDPNSSSKAETPTNPSGAEITNADDIAGAIEMETSLSEKTPNTSSSAGQSPTRNAPTTPRQRSKAEELVWKLDSLILTLAIIIVSWILIRYI